MKLLVTGGAGYVGSVCAAVLVEQGHDVTIIDNFSTGNREAVPETARVVEGDVVSPHVGLVRVDVLGQAQRVGVVGAATHQEHRRRLPRHRVERLDELVGSGEHLPTLDRARALVELRERVGIVRRQALEAVVRVVGQEAVVGGEHHDLIARLALQAAVEIVDVRVREQVV